MSERRTLHRTWPCECAVVRADDPARLAQALREAAARVGAQPEATLAMAARETSAQAPRGRLTAAIVAPSREALVARLGEARERIASGVPRVAEGGIHYERKPLGGEAKTLWLFEGGASVRPGMLRDLALCLPGFVEAFDRVAGGHPDPGEVADFLYGPEGVPSLDGATAALLALAAGRTLATWLLRLLPPPSRALGGPGAGGLWLDTRTLSPELFDACDLSAVAAPPTTRWESVLYGLHGSEETPTVVHVGPGPDGLNDIPQLLRALARLAAAGFPVDLEPLFDVRQVPTPSAPTSASRRRPFVFQPRSPRFDARAVTLPARAASPPPPVPAQPVAAADDAGADARAEVVLEYLETMRQFLDHQQAAVRRFEGGGPPPRPAPPADPGPMLHEVRELVPGERLLAFSRYDVREAAFLRQHTPNVSAVSRDHPGAFGLPVMPLTFSMEALAEAAALLAEGRVVTGFERLEAQRWMTFEADTVDVAIRAEVVARGERIEVEASLSDPADPKRLYLSGRVVLEQAYPQAPAAPALPDPTARSCGWGIDEIYPRRGFHGPMLRAITGVERHGDAGMTGELTVLPRAPLFASQPHPCFRIDPVLLDSLGMGVGIWTWREAMNGVYPVPFRVRRIRLYGPPCPEGEKLRLQVAITHREDGTIRADLFAARADGRVHAEARDWEDYVYRLPLAVHRIASDPFRQRIATPLTAAGWDDVAVCEFPDLPPGFLTSAEAIWEKILAWYWLSPGEREEWRALAGDRARRHAWLKGRAALKDAVRQRLAARGETAAAYDVVIRSGPGGGFAAPGASVALAGCGERWIAAAGDPEGGTLGLDLAPAALLDEASALVPEELARLRPLGAEWLARARAAKAAAARAVGAGPDADLRDLRVVGVEEASGRLRLTATGAWPAHGGLAGDLEVATARQGEHVLALCRVEGRGQSLRENPSSESTPSGRASLSRSRIGIPPSIG